MTAPAVPRAVPELPALQIARRRADLRWTLLSLLAIGAWELSRLDLRVSALFATAQGFALRDQWWLSVVLHDGVRQVSLAMLVAALPLALRAARPLAVPVAVDVGLWAALRALPRRLRLGWWGVTLALALLIPGLKRLSHTSCPWDLQAWGGRLAWVPHWQLGLRDGGPGHCFPSGHAVSAAAWFTLYFLLRGLHPAATGRRMLIGVLLAVAVSGLVQVLRGAHFVSHVLWSAWLCWAVCVVADRVLSRPDGGRASSPGAGLPAVRDLG
ncbi:MAG: hypothetical protein RIQ53_162 [Pseudomonadota bacterium]|jgi:membrane-associated PAP2 superfamily phosphatase